MNDNLFSIHVDSLKIIQDVNLAIYLNSLRVTREGNFKLKIVFLGDTIIIPDAPDDEKTDNTSDRNIREELKIPDLQIPLKYKDIIMYIETLTRMNKFTPPVLSSDYADDNIFREIIYDKPQLLDTCDYIVYGYIEQYISNNKDIQLVSLNYYYRKKIILRNNVLFILSNTIDSTSPIITTIYNINKSRYEIVNNDNKFQTLLPKIMNNNVDKYIKELDEIQQDLFVDLISSTSDNLKWIYMYLDNVYVVDGLLDPIITTSLFTIDDNDICTINTNNIMLGRRFHKGESIVSYTLPKFKLENLKGKIIPVYRLRKENGTLYFVKF